MGTPVGTGTFSLAYSNYSPSVYTRMRFRLNNVDNVHIVVFGIARFGIFSIAATAYNYGGVRDYVYKLSNVVSIVESPPIHAFLEPTGYYTNDVVYFEAQPDEEGHIGTLDLNLKAYYDNGILYIYKSPGFVLTVTTENVSS